MTKQHKPIVIEIVVKEWSGGHYVKKDRVNLSPKAAISYIHNKWAGRKNK